MSEEGKSKSSSTESLLKRSVNIPILTESMANDQSQFITWRSTTKMIITGLELDTIMLLDERADEPLFARQMLGKSLIYNAVKDVKQANGIFVKPLAEVPNGNKVLEALDKLFGLQITVAGRLLAQQRYETFSLVPGESIDHLSVRWFKTISEVEIQVGSVPSIEI